MRAVIRETHGNRIILEALEHGSFIEGDVVTLDKPTSKRTVDANAYLWLCLGVIAKEIQITPWDTYLMMLKRYGEYTVTLIKRDAYENFRSRWRECQIVEDVELNGEKFYRVLCFFGSSKYNKKEFSRLLDGVLSEIREMGLPVPPTKQDMADINNYLR